MTRGPHAAEGPWRPPVGALVAAMAAAMALYLGLTIWSGFGDVSDAFVRFPAMPRLGFVALLVLAGLLLRAARWRYFLRALDVRVPARDSLVAFLASFAFTATPGKAGEIVKGALLRERYGTSVTTVAGILVVERIGDLAAVLLLAAARLATVAGSGSYVAVSLLLIAGLVVLVTVSPVRLAALAACGRVPVLRRAREGVERAMEAGQSLLRADRFAAGLAVATIAWGCEALALHLILEGFGLRLGLGTALSLYGAATVVGAASLLPGGVGGVEAALLLMLANLGVARADALAPVLVLRLSTLWFVSALGMAFMALWSVEGRRPARMEVRAP